MRSASPTCPQCHARLEETGAGWICPACALEDALQADSEMDGPEPAAAFPRPFGGYELLGEIGRGGMGLVLKARQLNLGRLVALKVLIQGTFGDTAGRQRFRAEAETAARLQHPNIVAIHEVGEQDGVPYLTMDLIDGPDLGRLCDGRPLAPDVAARHVRDIARAVHAAHLVGVLHRDLKPSNILIGSDGRPRVTDFGLAKRDNAATSALTLSGQVLGSPSYAPPEQAAGRVGEIAEPSDGYGLGAILYHLLTGRAPFVAATATQTLRLVLESDPVPPGTLNPGVPRDLETICLKCLQKEPGRRYPTAAALAEDLGRFLEHRPILARPISHLGRGRRWCRRHPAAAVLGTLLFAVLASAAVISNVQARRLERARELAETARGSAVAARTDAEKLVTWLLDDLCTDIETSGHGDQVVKLAHQAVSYYASLPPESRSADTERREAQALSHLGKTLRFQAKFAEAAAASGRATRIYEGLRRSGDDSEATLAAFVEERCRMIADQARDGKSAGAVPEAEALVALIQPRAEAPGAAAPLRLGYARALTQLASCWSHTGNDPQGLPYLEHSLAIRRELLRAPDANLPLAIDTVWTMVTLVNVLARQLHPRTEIRSLFDDSVAEVQAILSRWPGSTGALSALGKLQDGLAMFYVGELNAQEALRWRREAIATWQQCCLLDPKVSDFQYSLRISRCGARYIEAADGHVTAALAGWPADLEECMGLQGSVYSLSELLQQWRYLCGWLSKAGDRSGGEAALARYRAVAERIARATGREGYVYEQHQFDLPIVTAQAALELGDFATAKEQARIALDFVAKAPVEIRPQLEGRNRAARSTLAWASLYTGDNAGAAAAADSIGPPPKHRYAQLFEYSTLRTPRALALARLGREAEARALIEPVVEFFRETLAGPGARCAGQEFLAWALYVEAAAQPPAAGDRRKALLAEAASLIAAMTDDYRALTSVRQLSDWIAADRAKLAP